MQHDSPAPLDAVAAQDNKLGADGAAALLPALEKLTSLTSLGLLGTCGYVQRRSAHVSRVGPGKEQVKRWWF